MSNSRTTRRFTITLKIPVEIEILRETDPAELDQPIDGEYFGWFWAGIGEYIDGLTTETLCDTKEDAIEDAKEFLHERFMQEATRE